MNNLYTDIGYSSLNKYEEQICGDCVKIVSQGEDSHVMVLADGLGSGVKANILSTLTSKIISTLMANGIGLEECVSTIASTLPVCKIRGIAYSTFTIIRVTDNNEAEIIQYDNPYVILLRNGRNMDYPKEKTEIGGKVISMSALKLQPDDVLIAMSDGAVFAGVGRTLNFGWQRENIIDYMERAYQSDFPAITMASVLIEACNKLYDGKPGDDTTVSVIKIRRRQIVNLMIGPPANPEDVNKMMAMFFAQKGRHIVCGGTTSCLAAGYLGKKIKTKLDYIDPEIPPTAEIEGIDLATEGIITMNKVLSYAKDCITNLDYFADWRIKTDGASGIAKILFEQATDINFFVGRAINPAHQNPELPVNFNIKMRIVEELSDYLRKMGKHISLCYF